MDNIILIGLTGKALSGKNTVADYLTKRFNAKQYAFATPLKQLAKDLFFWDGSKEMLPEPDKGRNLLIGIGNKLRDVRPTVWADFTLKQIEEYAKTNPPARICTITDLRYQNEAKLIQQAGGFIVRVQRPVGALQLEHISETELDDYKYDYTIINNGTLEELYARSDEVLQAITMSATWS